LLLLALGVPGFLPARIDLLLVPPPDTAAPSARPELTLYLNNPTEFESTIHFEAEITAEYADTGAHAEVSLRLVDETQRKVTVPKMSRRTVRLRPASDLAGRNEFVSLRLRSPETNTIMLRVLPAGPVSVPPAQNRPDPAADVTRHGLGRRNLDLTSDIENMRRHISGYEPIYLAVGSRERLNARFQFSFKYRVLDPGPESWEAAPGRALLGRLHFAYTQTSIWDLEGFSKPFYDSSYKPTVFLLHQFRRRPGSDWTFSLQAGAQHESNGKGGGTAPVISGSGLISAGTSLRHPLDTRSFNTLYALPRARWEDDGSRFFEAALRASAYFQADENPDIAQYRGYAELTLRGGHVRGVQLSAQLRGRIAGHGSVEFNLTWPTSETPLLRTVALFSTLGGYAQIQYFNGYGESLLDYDVRRRDQLRFGLMIVR
jgi:outer membrane phospholipase A